MSGLEGLFAIIVVALMPVALVLVSRYYALREKELALRAEGDLRRLDRLAAEKRLLEARVEVLEAIVCDAQYELDQRLRRLPPVPPAPPAQPAAPPSSAALVAARRPAPARPRPQVRTAPLARRSLAFGRKKLAG